MKEIRLTYHEGADGMLYPNLEMPEEQEVSLTQIGRYGMMAEKMKEVETEANSLMDTLMAEEVVLNQVVYRFR